MRFIRKGGSEKKPRMFSMWKHEGWGDSIFWWDEDKNRVTGHLTPLPRKGDLLRCKMKSGRICQYKFVEVEGFCNPGDQFMGTVDKIGYRGRWARSEDLLPGFEIN